MMMPLIVHEAPEIRKKCIHATSRETDDERDKLPEMQLGRPPNRLEADERVWEAQGESVYPF